MKEREGLIVRGKLLGIRENRTDRFFFHNQDVMNKPIFFHLILNSGLSMHCSCRFPRNVLEKCVNAALPSRVA